MFSPKFFPISPYNISATFRRTEQKKAHLAKILINLTGIFFMFTPTVPDDLRVYGCFFLSSIHLLWSVCWSYLKCGDTHEMSPVINCEKQGLWIHYSTSLTCLSQEWRPFRKSKCSLKLTNWSSSDTSPYLMYHQVLQRSMRVNENRVRFMMNLGCEIAGRRNGPMSGSHRCRRNRGDAVKTDDQSLLRRWQRPFHKKRHSPSPSVHSFWRLHGYEVFCPIVRGKRGTEVLRSIKE